MAYIARTDGTREIIDPADVTIEFAQKVVGGYVERVCPAASPLTIFLCNEDGVGPLNKHGTELYGYGQPIVGDIIVMTRKEGEKWL